MAKGTLKKKKKTFSLLPPKLFPRLLDYAKEDTRRLEKLGGERMSPLYLLGLSGQTRLSI